MIIPTAIYGESMTVMYVPCQWEARRGGGKEGHKGRREGQKNVSNAAKKENK